MIRVLLADDEELVRTGFRLILQATPDIQVVGEAVDGGKPSTSPATSDHTRH
jgi:YesN/AraC family two-component response regulator